MAEWSANAVQIVNPGEAIVFTENPVPARNGLVRHRDDTGAFLLSGKNIFGYTPCCPYMRNNLSANYFVDFGANISIPTTGTVGAITVAIAADGVTIPASQMEVTPAAVNEYFNVSRAINALVWVGCCESISVINTSDQPIQVQNANINIDGPNRLVG